ncbi:MAG: GNAT family protein [Bacillota bacterium]|nr:GNAT family protein [Bacillota bacterium]
MTAMKVVTPRLIIREPQDGDAEALLEARNSEFVNRYNAYPKVSLEEFKEEIRELPSFVMTNREDGSPIGCLYLKEDPIRYQTGSKEIAGWFKEEYAHKGLASELLSPLIKKLFEEGFARRFATHVLPGNAASIRLMEKMGFKQEGYLKEALLDENGEPSDVILYSMGKDDCPF